MKVAGDSHCVIPKQSLIIFHPSIYLLPDRDCRQLVKNRYCSLVSFFFLLFSEDHVHCCGFTEAVIRLVISALVGVVTVAVLVYDILSTREGGKKEIS